MLGSSSERLEMLENCRRIGMRNVLGDQSLLAMLLMGLACTGARETRRGLNIARNMDTQKLNECMLDARQ